LRRPQLLFVDEIRIEKFFVVDEFEFALYDLAVEAGSAARVAGSTMAF
jgi:hypothetical protein